MVAGVTMIQLSLLSYHNPTSRLSGGDCCDAGASGVCRDKCDNRFEICVSRQGSDVDMTLCSFFSANTTKIVDNSDQITFPSSLLMQDGSSLPNPLTISIPDAWGGVRFKVRVWDVDAVGEQEVDILTKNINYYPDPNLAYTIQWKPNLSGTGDRKLKTGMRVYCGDGYFGPRCHIYCADSATYTCEQFTGKKLCVPGWGGIECDEDIAECASSPCQQGGACINLVNSYRCECIPGTFGTLCENNHNNCTSVECQNGGTCQDQLNDFQCTCTENFQGRFCEVLRGK
eukprot:XP_003728170.1 PREDICTED: delta-like protein 1 [Strongylocentrotus purpuratus]